MSPGSPNVPLGKLGLVFQLLWRTCGAVPPSNLPREWRPSSWVPKAGEQLQCQQQWKEVGRKKEEEEEEAAAGWLLFCLGHTHTLLISNDGKGNTH